MTIRTWSLSRRLTLSIMAVQAATLFAFTCIGLALTFSAAPDGVIIHPQLLNGIASSLQRGDATIRLEPNEQLREFIANSPDLWMVVRDESGEDVTFGPVPEIASYLMDVSGELRTIDIRGADGNSYLTSRFESVASPVGRVSIWAGGGALISDATAIVWLSLIVVIIPVVTLLVLTAISLPLVIRRSFRSVREVARQIDAINYQVRGTRIAVGRVPNEIHPMVRGFNQALRRIDEGAETTERFFVNAAHELRTPIAILQVRLDALEQGPETEKFKLVVRRLATLAKQLLTIETYRQSPNERRRLDLGLIVAEAVGDLAPYAMAEGYTISLDRPKVPVWIRGDGPALDRLFVNIVQNAIQHGGGTGEIRVRVTKHATVEVIDEGPGIPDDKRERIFEAFYRVNAHGNGSGLGLKMVRDIARSHGGDVVLKDRTGTGSTFLVCLPTERETR